MTAIALRLRSTSHEPLTNVTSTGPGDAGCQRFVPAPAGPAATGCEED